VQLFESKEVGGDQPRSDCECDDDDECGHLRSVEPDGVVMKWWRMNAPRSGPEFYHPDEKKKAQGPKTSCARKQAQGTHAMIPELCEFRVGDEIMAAADYDWWCGEVLEVEAKCLLVKIRYGTDDNLRYIEYTKPPSKPPDQGHRLLSCTVHLDELPIPWQGSYFLDVTQDAIKGDWLFWRKDDVNQGLGAPALRVMSKADPTERDVAALFCPVPGLHGEREASTIKLEVMQQIKRAKEEAKRRWPYLTISGHCSDLCDPELIDENYGGECCWRCGGGGHLVICSGCEDKGRIPYVEHPECFDRPQADMPPEDEDWLCNQCKTESFNGNLVRTSRVVNDEHVRYVLHKFLPVMTSVR